MINPEECEELLLLNVFSTVAVTDNEVVAVVSRGLPGLTLEVIASTTENPIITPPSTGVLSQVLQVMFTKNYAWPPISDPHLDTVTLKQSEPTISDARDLAGMDLVGLDDEELKKYVDEHW